jgi:hypothetical protein
LARAAKALISLGAPDSVRCARLALVKRPLSGIERRCTAINHRTVRWCNGRSSQRSAAQSGRDAWPGQRSEGGTRLSGVLTAPNHQRSAAPKQERNLHRTVSGGAPDCPVHQSTEGKICLLGLLSTAPSCLGAIKGTPRRMKENTKHTLSILDHSHFVFANSFDILSDLSSVLVRTL